MKNVNFFLRINFSRMVMLIAFCALLTGLGFSQGTTLVQGDISFAGFSGPSSPKTFSFVTWKELAVGTVIRFTDNGFHSNLAASTATNNFRGGEQTVTWTATSVVDSGTVVIINPNGVANSASTGTAAHTNASGTAATSLQLGTSTGDQIFAFQSASLPPSGTTSTFTGTILFGIYYQGSAGTNTNWKSSGVLADGSESYVPSDLLPANTLFFGSFANSAQYNSDRTGLANMAAYRTKVRTIGLWSLTTGTIVLNTAHFVAIPLAVAPSITGQPSSSTICAGSNTSFAVTASNATGYQWHVSTNGGSSFSPLTNTGVYSGATSATLNITGATGAMNNYQYRVVVTGTASPDATSNAVTLTVNSPATIASDPSNSTVCAGLNTSFTVSASNATYQWYLSTNSGSSFSPINNGGVYSGATTQTLNLTGVTAGMSGYQYRVVVSGLCSPASTTSLAVTLTVNSAPLITQNPTAAIVCDGGSTSMNVTATSASSYQWQINTGSGYTNITNGVGAGGATYSGANTATLSISNTSVSMSGYFFRSIAIGSCTPSSTSDGAELTVSTNVTYYQDFDGDGYGNPNVTQVRCTGAPVGYVTNNTDCNDGDVNVHAAPAITAQASNSTICAGNNTTFVVTATGGTSYQWEVNPGSGFVNVANGGVYSNATTSALTITGATAGMNGYAYRLVVSNSCSPAATSGTVTLTVNSAPTITQDPSAQSTCEFSSATFSATASNATGYQWQVNPGSGFVNISNGTGSAGEVYSGATTAALTVSNTASSMSVYTYRLVASGLCTPDATSTAAALTSLQNVTYYRDVDTDGYGDAATTTISCSGAPSGYVSNSLDCDDNDVNVYPGAIEICDDGIDNNCDGNIDEGCGTQVTASQCNATLLNINTPVNADAISGATTYRFRVTNGANVQTIDKATPSFQLTELPSHAFNTTYTVDVSVEVSGSFSPYGTACNVSTPAQTTKVRASQCGVTLASIGTAIYADALAGATQYRFRVTNGATVQTIDRAVNSFTLNQLGTYGYGITYSVEVAVETNGSFGAYGPACNVTLDALKTKVKSSQCGITVANLGTVISANAVSGATQYRFRVINGANTQTIEGPSTSFSFNQLAIYNYATTYTVDVAIEMYGSGSFEAYGTACLITTPAAPLTQVKAAQCGTTLPALSTTINANPVADATQYRFRVTNGANVQIINKPTASFNLTELSSFDYETVYTVDVAVETIGSFGAYGTACNVITPSTLTKVRAAQCGVTLVSTSTVIFADVVSDATRYRFRVTNGANVQIIDRPTNSFNLTQLASSAYGTAYTIDVATEINGSFGIYGTACIVTTPIPASKIRPAQCGVTLATIGTAILANEVAGATHYRFRVTNGSNVQTFISPTRSFSLNQLTTFASSTTYTIDVSIEINGNFGAYGIACDITSPSSPLTQVEAAQCGTTLATLSTPINADAVIGATQYRFRITNGSDIQWIDKPSNSFSLTELPSTTYSTVYSVEVAVLASTSWGAYGPICHITTPAYPLQTTQVRASQCGATLASISTNILADNVAGATQYRFRVTEGANVQTIDKPTNSFALTQLANYAYGTTYTVEVAIEMNGSFGIYGAACSVTTPKLTTKIRTGQCGITLATIGTTISANSVSGATQYRFRIINGSNVQIIDRASFSFSLTELASFEYGTTYSIDVAAETNGSFGPYGPVCDVTTPEANSGSKGSGDQTALLKFLETGDVSFDVVTFPNPFTSEFGLKVSTGITDLISVTVYDMSGKVLTSTIVSPQEISDLRVGEGFAAGIYQVKVVQGTETKTLKVVKQ